MALLRIDYDKIVDDDFLKQEYIQWFKDEYGIPPVITSSTGLPAVRFAQYIIDKTILKPRAAWEARNREDWEAMEQARRDRGLPTMEEENEDYRKTLESPWDDEYPA